MVLTTEVITDNIPIKVSTLGITKNPSTRKTNFRFMTYLMSNIKIVSTNYVPLILISKQPGRFFFVILFKSGRFFTNIGACVKLYIYGWILQNSQFVKSSISNECIKVLICGHTKNNTPEILFQVSVR